MGGILLSFWLSGCLWGVLGLINILITSTLCKFCAFTCANGVHLIYEFIDVEYLIFGAFPFSGDCEDEAVVDEFVSGSAYCISGEVCIVN